MKNGVMLFLMVFLLLLVGSENVKAEGCCQYYDAEWDDSYCVCADFYDSDYWCDKNSEDYVSFCTDCSCITYCAYIYDGTDGCRAIRDVCYDDPGMCVGYACIDRDWDDYPKSIDCNDDDYSINDCNKLDGCYSYGTGCEDRDYYCSGGSCTYTSSNHHTDYYDDWVYYCKGTDEVWKHRLFHDFYCGGGTCTDHTSWTDDQFFEYCMYGCRDAKCLQPPVATRNNPTNRDVYINVGEGITFEVGATDSDGNLMEVDWDIDDVTQITNSISGYSNTDSWSHTFNTAGDFTVEAWVWDTDDECDYVDWIVHVTQLHPPDPPSLISPGSGSEPGQEIDTLTPTFSWNSVSNADYYGLYVSKYPYGSSNIVFENEGVYGTSLTLSSGILQDGVKYRWNMRSHNSAGWGSFSDKLYFHVDISNEQINGIDVSHHQGSIDWPTVYNSDYKFAFVKATEGVDYPDPNFETNMNRGSNAGILMGAYHFATPYTNSQNDAVAEAQYFVNVSSDYLEDGYLRPVLDLERGADLNTETLSNWVHDWMNTVETATGVEPILYVSSNYANNHLDSSVSQYDLWIAHWTYDPDMSPDTGMWADWDFWQYSDKGSVPGINGDIDLDIFNGDMARLNTFIIHGSQPNRPPVAGRNYPTTRDVYVNVGDAIIFEVGATDENGNLMEAIWLLDDITQVTNLIFGYSDTDNWSHTFNTAGNFMVEGFVRDTYYEIDYVDWIVHVNQAPTATIDSIMPDSAEQGTDTVSFAGHGTDLDGFVVASNWRSSIDGQLSTSLSFTKSASDLSVGKHTIYLKVQDDDGAWSTENTEDLTIEPASVPVLTYSPASHNFGDMCEGETDSTTFEIWNSGSGTLTYSLSENCGWVDVSPTSGSSTGAHDAITVNVDTNSLSEGSHTCDIAISSDDGSGTFTVTVNIVSCEEPELSYSPASHNFGDRCEGETDSTTFGIWNSGSGTLTYSLSESCGWVDVQPNGSSSTGEHDAITVNIDTTGLSKGSHACDIAINSNDGSGTFTVDVTVINIPVLLVHGFGGSPIETWGTMKERLENDGFKVETVLLEPYGDIKVNANLLAQKIHGEGGMLDQYHVNKVNIVAHSMGGLVSRWYIQHDAYKNDINKLVMIGTPNHGVWDAKLAAAVGYGNPAAEQMIPNSPILNNLNSGTLNVEHYVIMGRVWYTYASFLKPTFEGDGLVSVKSATLSSAEKNYKTYDAHADIVYRYHAFPSLSALLNGGGIWPGSSEGGTLTTSLAAYSYVTSILHESNDGQNKVIQQITTNDQQTDTYIQPPKVFNDTLHPGENITYIISINSTDVKADFRVCWADGDLALVLYTPNGTVINKSTAMNNSNIDYFENTAYKFRHYAVQNPETGNWTMEITAINVSNSGENYTALIYLETSLIFDISVDKYLFDPNQYMNISAKLMNNDMAVIGASVTAKIHKPDNTTENITLYDDGLHRDNLTNDGIYANTYTNTSVSGTYYIAASATGTLDGEEFERTASTTVWVEQYPDLTLSSLDIYFSNDAASAGDNITINTTIHNIGDADANNASILFYDGAPVSGTYIGNDTITVASGGIADAAVSWTVIGGDHEIHVVVSPYNAFIEMDYSNNQAHKLIQVNQPPNPSFTYSPSIPVVNQTITFNASSSYDPDDGFITNYEWNFDDGNTTNTTNPITSHYSSAGNYSVTLTVTDDDGALNSTSAIIDVDVTSVIPLPDYTDPPTDPDQDGLYEDLNGNMMVDFNDIVLYFQYMDWIEANEPIACFDFNGNGLIDFDDLVKLFEEV